MIELRPYQTDMVEKIRQSIRSGHRAPLLVAPCGSGKTVLFSFFTSEAAKRGKRTLILCHREELLEQISNTLTEFNVNHSFIAAKRGFNRVCPVHVGSVFSVVRRLGTFAAPDIIIVDECHHGIQGSSWGRVLDSFRSAIRLGVTATPQRLSGEPLRDMFDDLIVGPSMSDLIESGYLSPFRIFAPPGIDTSGVHRRGGDFARNELEARANRSKITGDAVTEYRRRADGLRTVVYCVSRKHAKAVADDFNAAGYSAQNLDGSFHSEVRRQIVNDFRAGRIQILATCDLISEGFDLPAIECAIMLRPTQSLGLWIQQSGRSLRVHPGKECALILDHAGNTLRHGLPDDPRKWSLDGTRKAGHSDAEQIRRCPKCYHIQRPGPPKCAMCGTVFPVKERKINHVSGELQEVDLVAARRSARAEQSSAVTLADLVALGKRRKYKNPYMWAQHVLRARGNRLFAGTGT